VAGLHHKLLAPAQVSLGYGYTAIIVAWLARGRVPAVLLTALLMGWIFACGDVLKGTLRMPFQIVEVLHGMLLLLLIGGERWMQYRVHWARTPVRHGAAERESRDNGRGELGGEHTEPRPGI
jgi:simple sugar transport system permease protein